MIQARAAAFELTTKDHVARRGVPKAVWFHRYTANEISGNMGAGCRHSNLTADVADGPLATNLRWSRHVCSSPDNDQIAASH